MVIPSYSEHRHDGVAGFAFDRFVNGEEAALSFLAAFLAAWLDARPCSAA
jgi:hypothetical protein